MIKISLPLRWVPKYEYGNKRPTELRGKAYPAVYRWAVYGKNGRLKAVYIGESYNICRRVRRYRVPRTPWKPPLKTTKRVSQFLENEKREGNLVRFELLDFDPFVIHFEGGISHINPKGLSGQETRRFLENLALLSVDRTVCEIVNRNPDFFDSRASWAKRLRASREMRDSAGRRADEL